MTFDLPCKRVTAAVAIVTLIVAFGFAADVAAQENDRVAIEEESVGSLGRQLKSFSPRSGPPGTLVTLRAENMPVLSPLRIGVGALRLGFEEVGWILSNREGEFTFEVEIPAWAGHDVAHFFIAFDPYFNPIALSDVFHVTGPNGSVVREGRIADDEHGCPTLTGADRVPYALLGDVSGLEAGADVVVKGTIAEKSVCGERTAIEDVRIQPAYPSSPRDVRKD